MNAVSYKHHAKWTYRRGPAGKPPWLPGGVIVVLNAPVAAAYRSRRREETVQLPRGACNRL